MTPQAYIPDDLRRYLAGRWRVERLAEDRRSDARHRMTGTVDFTPDGDALAYHEAVTWTLDGQTFNAERRYRYAFPDPAAPLTAEVSFPDGAPFHALDLAQGACTVAHACPPDRYDGHYRLLDRDRFQLRWCVTGPRKDLILTTLFQRAEADLS